MKRLIISICVVLCAAATVLSDTQTIDGQTWMYTLSKNGEATILWVEGQVSGELVIPEKLGGCPVTAIAGDAFGNSKQLRRVTFPNALRMIGERAFQNCNALTSVAIPNGVTNVGECAFIDCSGLKSVTVPQCVCDDGLWFAFDADNITKVVIADGATAIGDFAFEGCYNLTLLTIPNTVQFIGDHAFEACYALRRVMIPEGVEEVGAAAFMDCFDLESVTLPSSLTSIGANAFAGCLSLTGVSLPDGLMSIGAFAFDDCYSLNRLTLPSQLETIGSGAFRNSGLTSASIPNSVTNVGAGAFASCAALSTVTITQKILDLGVSNVFDTNLAAGIVIADGVRQIPSSAFEGFKKITSVTFPVSMEEIYDRAFFGCESLTRIDFPEVVSDPHGGGNNSGVFYIGSQAFEGCCSLTSLTIPEVSDWSGVSFYAGPRAFANCYGLKNITGPSEIFYSYEIFDIDDPLRCRRWETVVVRGYNYNNYVSPDAFSGLPNLRTVTLPASVRSIGDFAFQGCTKLESVTIESGSTWGGDLWEYYQGDDSWVIGTCAFRDCASLVRVDIPEGVTQIGDSAFAGCAKLAAVTLPESVQAIGSSAFRDCRSLASVNFPEAVTLPMMGGQLYGGVRSIGSQAFEGCASLAAADLPACLGQIGGRAFWVCYALTDVTLPKCVFDCRYTYKFYDTSTWDWRTETLYGLDAVFGSRDDGEHPCRWERVTVLNNDWGDEPSLFDKVPSNAFSGLQNLRTVTLPSSVRTIGDYAFEGCAKLESVTIEGGSAWDGDLWEYYNGGIRAVGTGAFRDCASLVRVDIPEGVTQIGDSAFAGCAKLADVTLPESVEWIGREAFAGCGLTSATIRDSVTQIGESVFWDCVALKNVTLPKRVEEVGLWNVFGFSDTERPCPWEAVTLLDGWTAVDVNLFAGLQNLKSVTLPASVRTIGEGAFSGCVGLRDMTFGGNAPSAIGVGAFSGISSNCTAWVKKGSTGWGGEIAGRWQGMRIDYQPSSLYLPSLSYGANVVATQTDRGWTVASPNGSVLTRSVLTSLKVNVMLPDGSEVDTTKGYEKALSADGTSVEMRLKTPEIALAAETGKTDEDDPSGLLVDVPEALLATKPATGEGESVGALPVKAVKGLWYQASWGGDLQGLTQGEKVQATGDSLYLGVIKQTGASGFYRLSVSEK